MRDGVDEAEIRTGGGSSSTESKKKKNLFFSAFLHVGL